MTAFIDLQGEVLSEVPQADVILLDRSVKRAARRFCAGSLVLTTTTSPAIDIVADQHTYTLPAVANRDIVRIVRRGVKWGDDVYPEEKSEDQLDRDGGPSGQRYFLPEDAADAALLGAIGTPWRNERGVPPIYFYQPSPTTIRLVPIPNVALTAQLEVNYALKPSLLATEVDDFIISNWYETLVKGAIAELLMMRQKPWTDVVLGKDYEASFDEAIADVAAERVSGFASNDYAVGHVRSWV